MPWRRKWKPTPVFLPGKSHGQRSLAGYSPWGHKESDMSEHKHKLLTMWFDPFVWIAEDLENLKIATGSMYFIKGTALNDPVSEHRFMKLALLCYIHQHVPKPAGVVITSSFTCIERNQMLSAFQQLTSCRAFLEFVIIFSRMRLNSETNYLQSTLVWITVWMSPLFKKVWRWNQYWTTTGTTLLLNR